MKFPVIRLVLLAVALTTLGMPLAASDGLDRPARKLKIVVFGGHPDDPESGAGGLLDRYRRGESPSKNCPLSQALDPPDVSVPGETGRLHQPNLSSQNGLDNRVAITWS